MKPLLITFSLIVIVACILLYVFRPSTLITIPHPPLEIIRPEKSLSLERLHVKASATRNFIRRKNFSDQYVFLIDMSLPSGKKRFFIYDIKRDSIINAGLVAHGSCRTGFLEDATFSNVPECGCSSLGRYKVGYAYEGQFGGAFKLHGLDSTNSNAFKRAIVLHAYDGVPDKETYPQPICNSLGCPMVSYKFLNSTKEIIAKSKKPVLLWIYK